METIKTLDTLPGENETRTRTEKATRRTCDECGEPAHLKHGFLYEGFRSNPASSAYGRDDCSWCEDEAVFTCRECKPTTPEGCVRGSTFYATERFAHMFLRWIEAK